jgi:hypothetical protein
MLDCKKLEKRRGSKEFFVEKIAKKAKAICSKEKVKD